MALRLVVSSTATSKPHARTEQRQRRPLCAAAAQPDHRRWPVAAPWVGAAAAAALLLGAPEAHAIDVSGTFTRSCAGCHAGGGNVIRRDATLQLSDLQKYGMDSEEGLYQVIYRGKNAMPGFGQDCAPKGACTFGPRLSDEEIQGLAEFVLANAQAGWPQPQ